MSELLREKQGDGQVTKEQDGQSQGDEGDRVDLHGLPQLLAGLDVKKRQTEENYREQQHRYILHSVSQFQERDVREAACSRTILALALFDYQKDFLNKS
ncbi:MAG: hypothetical protein ABSF70_19375 [Terracidiphilus sp.]|jgi:hypothetical protein